jgi:hypothetical protein
MLIALLLLVEAEEEEVVEVAVQVVAHLVAARLVAARLVAEHPVAVLDVVQVVDLLGHSHLPILLLQDPTWS